MIGELVNSDLPAFSSVQTKSLWRVLYHRRAKSLSRKLRNKGAKVRSVTTARERNVPIGGHIIREKAFAKELKITDFKASEG